MSELESDRIERTISFREDKLGPAICAFSNDLPDNKKEGYLLLGVRDDGTVNGSSIGDRELQKIGAVRSDGNILPQPHIVVSSVFHLPEGDVIVIKVHPSDFPPVRYRGRVYIRVGPGKGIASSQEERMLSEKRIAIAKTFDKQPCQESTLNDISIDLFKLTYLPQAIDRETLEENNRATKEQLASLGFYDLIRDCCTNAGVLLFGLNPKYFFPGAYIQYVKFNSVEMDADKLQTEKEFSGDLLTVLKNLNDFVLSSVAKQKIYKTEGFQQRTHWNYPIWALRELLMNAVMHRDYESNAPIYFYEFTDRIEIINPGGLYGDVRPENFPDASDYRNPIIASSMKIMGYVNRFNFGVKNAERKLAENGNPSAKFNLTLQTKFFVAVGINKNWDA
ncbi:MAG: ATP-binding protein [Bacteroidota bacterium]